MHFKHFASLSLAAAFASTLLMSGCAVHARVYDPYYHDYHARDHETVYYNQWEHDSTATTWTLTSAATRTRRTTGRGATNMTTTTRVESWTEEK